MSVPGPSVPGPSSQILDWVRVRVKVRVRVRVRVRLRVTVRVGVRVRVAVQELTVQELSGSHFCCTATEPGRYGSGPVVLQPTGPTAHWSYDPNPNPNPTLT